MFSSTVTACIGYTEMGSGQPTGAGTQAPCCRRLMRGAAEGGDGVGGRFSGPLPHPGSSGCLLGPGIRAAQRRLEQRANTAQRCTTRGGRHGVPHTTADTRTTTAAPKRRRRERGSLPEHPSIPGSSSKLGGGCFQPLRQTPSGWPGSPSPGWQGRGSPGAALPVWGGGASLGAGGRGDAGDAGGEGGPAAAARRRAERGAHVSEDDAGRPVQEMKASSLGAQSGMGSASVLGEHPTGSFPERAGVQAMPLFTPARSPAPILVLHPAASVGEAPVAGTRPPPRPCPHPTLNAPR